MFVGLSKKKHMEKKEGEKEGGKVEEKKEEVKDREMNRTKKERFLSGDDCVTRTEALLVQQLAVATPTQLEPTPATAAQLHPATAMLASSPGLLWRGGGRPGIHCMRMRGCYSDSE